MKLIKKLTLDEFLMEGLKLSDEHDLEVLKTRLLDLYRVKAQLEKAKQKAEGPLDNPEAAAKIQKQIDKLQALIDSAYVDSLEDEQPEQTNSSSSSDKEEDDTKLGDDKGDKKSDDSKETTADENNPTDKVGQDSDSKQGNRESDPQDNKEGNTDTEEADSEEKTDSDDKSPIRDDSVESDPDFDHPSSGGNNNSQDSSDNQNSDSTDNSDSQSSNQTSSDSSNDSKDQDKKDASSSNQSQSNDSIQDPFADKRTAPQSMGKPNAQKDATFDDIKNSLVKLEGEARRGALDGLKKVLGGTNESLEEALALLEARGLRDLSDEEFSDILNTALDTIDNIIKVKYGLSPDARAAKVKAMRGQISDRILQQELAINQKLDADRAKDPSNMTAREREIERYSNIRPISSFAINFYHAIDDQISLIAKNVKALDATDPHGEGEGIYRKVLTRKNVIDESIPIVHFYFDVSSSWDSSDSDRAKQAVASIKDFVDQGLVKVEIWYFADEIGREPVNLGWGTSAWNKIINNIKASGANNIILMTDRDMSGQAARGGITRVDGCVWFIWKTKYDQCPEIINHLIGRQGNLQYYLFN